MFNNLTSFTDSHTFFYEWLGYITAYFFAKYRNGGVYVLRNEIVFD